MGSKSAGVAALVLLVAACADDANGTQMNNALPGSGTGGSPPLLVAGAGATAGGGTGGAAAGAGGMIVPPTAGSSGGAGAGAGAGGTGGMTAGSGGDGGGSGMAGADPDSGTPPPVGTLPPVDSTDADGPFETTVDENGGENTWVFHPTDLGRNGIKHPIFVWGTGATSVPSQYMDHFTRMASHGIVVISPDTGSVNGTLLGAALDWILAENDRMGSTYYQKLDPDNVAMGGHSLGSVSTFDREAMEDRLKTTIHIAGGSFDGQGSSKVKTPTAYICGETDFALPNCEGDWEAVEDQPTFFSVLAGIDHVGAARAALPGMIAWLRWHIAGEVERKADFTCPGGQFCMGIWDSQNKNW